MSKENNSYDKMPEGAPIITPDMVGHVHKTLEARGLLYYHEGKVYVPTEKGWGLLQEIKPAREEINAYGSPHITATSGNCIGLTKSADDEHLKDCLIGVKADKAPKDFGDDMRHSLKGACKVKITIEADGVSDTFFAFGSPALKLSSLEEIAIKKDDTINAKTVVIMSDKSATDLKRELVEKLKDSATKVKIILEIK